ncbi:3-mercaptopyruvate sulfurtransferase [Lichenifustis flavocetrariae]|uniref:Sulfurtransferase n=1 Tax=Lichenifustis flavocetrariae TaxID=2949735 RepID=A0AA41YR98_9HYPH|nr:3-mercaptopyruvate sulfurtransferase [Lichenifustis flavocetrariae]MCW6506699.1 3-mercaptopyruvate sulfurtransferase [Lichenifustis flavocetrariae]
MVDTRPNDALASPFVTTDWLAARIADPHLVVIDGSWYLPTQNRDGRQDFENGHIPGAVFFDVDGLSDASSGLPHMLLDPESFGRAVGALGIPSDATLIVYDGMGLFSAPRVWWTLRIFGARDVRLLDGGMPKWKAEGRPIEAGAARRPPASFTAHQQEGAVADFAAVRHALETGAARVVDARPAARFKGEAPEPRPGVRAGHMPGSLNVPFSDLIADGSLKSQAALRSAFADAGIDLSEPVIATCGSGVSAAILVLALATLGKADAALYDGSWAEYGSRSDVPVVTGA